MFSASAICLKTVCDSKSMLGYFIAARQYAVAPRSLVISSSTYLSVHECHLLKQGSLVAVKLKASSVVGASTKDVMPSAASANL